MKRIVESDPLGMLQFLGLTGASAEPFDADLATINPQADYILRVTEPDYLAHIEFQSTYRAEMSRRMLLYGAVAHYNTGLPIESSLILLREQADGPAITGRLEYGSNTFLYKVIRLWELPPESILNGPIALLPLLPLTKTAGDTLPSFVDKMEALIQTAPFPGDLWAETMLLMGLKYDEEYSLRLLERVIRNMRDSSTYQAVLAEGKAEGLTQGQADGERNFLLRGGTKRFGPPDAKTRAALESVDSQETLERLFDRLFEVSSWEDLLS